MATGFISETELRKAIKQLKPNNQLFEVRLLGGGKTISGYFKDADTLMEQFRTVNTRDMTAYITINAISDDCFARVQSEHFKQTKQTTSDNNIIGYDWLFIDFDPDRTAGISATNGEMQKAFQLAHRVYEFLRQQGFEEPVKAMSGNGAHLLYKIGLTNTEENIKLVEKVLKALAYLFDTDDVKVDTSNFNPSRICKLYGTRAQKGADTAERPHRMSRIIGDVRPVLQTDRVYLEKIADMLPQVEQPQAYNNYSPATFDIESWMDEHGIRYTKKEWKDATRYVLDECPFNHDHHAPDSMILKQPSGAIGFRCLHNSCSGKTWRDVRIMYEPGAYDYAEKDAADSARINAGWKEHNKNRNDLHYEIVEVETDDNPIFENAAMIYAKPEEKNEFIETGIMEIDNNIGGLEKTKVTVVSGLRAAAKSTLLSQIMLNAINAGETVLCYSGELTDRNFLSWMLRQAAGAEVEAFNTRHGANYIAPETKEKIVAWMGERFWLYNNDYGNDFDKIKQRLERGIREKKADLCVIDNLAILYLAAWNYDKYEAQTNFVKDLLSIAKRANCHIVFVAHPRKAEGFLRLDDIAGSGNLANLVDNALIVHRVNNDFKRLTAQMFKWKESNPIYEATNVVEIAKARESGAQDVFVPLWYEDKTKRLKNYPGESFAYSWNADGFRPVEDDEVEF